MQRKPQTARQTERKQHGQQGEFFLEVENCTNIRRLHSNMSAFFQSKLVTSADKSSDVTCRICLPFPACWTGLHPNANAMCQLSSDMKKKN